MQEAKYIVLDDGRVMMCSTKSGFEHASMVYMLDRNLKNVASAGFAYWDGLVMCLYGRSLSTGKEVADTDHDLINALFDKRKLRIVEIDHGYFATNSETFDRPHVECGVATVESLARLKIII